MINQLIRDAQKLYLAYDIDDFVVIKNAFLSKADIISQNFKLSERDQ